ncbi:MAG: HPr family phosphocarrier protein [Clostridiales Family XIII bacterium]|jgi:phosphocarrier protein|nr:HPr family phosphocarrier protein [Clostridiales Family XIII bacterium]
MIQAQLEVRNELGIHARVANRISSCCQGFSSRIEAESGTAFMDLKSVLNVMILNVKYGEKLTVAIEGEDENEAFESLKELFDNKFGEK